MIPNRRFLHEVLRRGLELRVVSPDDVLQQVTPDVLAHHLPIGLKAKLLQASLGAERMTPELVVQVVGVEALVEHAPMPVLWACVRASAARQLQGQADDGLAASLRIAPGGSGPGNGGAARATQEMTPAMVPPHPVPAPADDLQFKTPRPARPSSLRPGSTPPRISALSPRSQALRRGADASSQATGSVFETSRGEDPPDFEIVEDSEVPNRQHAGRVLSDEETRPGNKP